MNEQDTAKLVDCLRSEILKCEEIINRPKSTDHGTGNDPEFSRGYWTGRKSACHYIFSKLVESGVKFEPDLNLISEAENLIPKGAYWCGHELNRNLHHYLADFKNKDYSQCVLNEVLIRRGVVKARIEALKFLPLST